MIDRRDGRCYRRILTVGKEPLEVSVTQPEKRKPLLQVAVRGSDIGQDEQLATEESVKVLLGTEMDLSAFYRFARRDTRLRPLVERFRGFKPPRFPSVFEAAVNAIACQQITLTVGIMVLNRLTAAYGRAFAGRDGTVHAFPLPEDLAETDPEEFRKLGLSRQKAHALLELSQKITDKTVNLEGLREMDDETAIKYLRGLRGIGRWSAEYVLLRGLGRTHIFPADDVGGRNNLRRLLGLRKPLDDKGTSRILARWRPYGGLIYFHLLLGGIEEEASSQS